MFCRNCGNKVNENDNFCQHCGEKIIKEQATETVIPEVVESVSEEKTETTFENVYQTREVKPKEEARNKFDVFACVGFGLGLGAFISSFFYMLFNDETIIVAAIAGLVFSILGKKSPNCKTKASSGLGFSIAAIAIALTMIIIVAALEINVY